MLATTSLAICWIGGWLIVRAPGFIWWDAGWRYVAFMNAIASVACVVAIVAVARRSISSLATALLVIALSYSVVYHAVSLFGLIA